MISLDRLGVKLLPPGVTPLITKIPDSYDFGNRTRTVFEKGGDIALHSSRIGVHLTPGDRQSSFEHNA